MSSFVMNAKNKKTGELIEVLAIDDYFGRHQYGYSIGNKGAVYRENEFFDQYTREKQSK